MNRIFILGASGSGKTTFAKRLSESLDIPFYPLDFMVFDENWKKRDFSDRVMRLKEVARKSEWIIEGQNASDWVIPALKKVELVIVLDYSKWTLFFRVFKRFLQGLGRNAYGGLGSLYNCMKFAFRYDVSKHIWVEKYASKVIIVKTPKELEKFYLTLVPD